MQNANDSNGRLVGLVEHKKAAEVGDLSLAQANQLDVSGRDWRSERRCLCNCRKSRPGPLDKAPGQFRTPNYQQMIDQ